MRRKNHSIKKNLNQIVIKFDNFDKNVLNRLIAYSSIINSLNYKWYKSSKRRLLLPNFYFTRLFYTFIKNYFSRNIFRKNIQNQSKLYFYNPIGFFEKRMFLQNIALQDQIQKIGEKIIFFNRKNIIFLQKNKFFFKQSHYPSITGSNIVVPSDLLLDLDSSFKCGLFLKNAYVNTNFNFNLFIYFYIFNCSVVEIYKIFILLSLNNLQFF